MHEEIASVINLYSIALDSRSWDLFDLIFTEDVVCDYCHVLKWNDLASFRAEFTEMHEATAGHQHFLGPPQIVVKGDRAWALTYGRFNLFRVARAEKVDDMSQGGAWYDDELRRTPAGWRICKRTARNFWWQGTMPQDGPHPVIVDSFPQLAREGKIGFLNALREQAGRPVAAAESVK